MRTPSATPEEQAFIKAHHSDLSVTEIAERLKLNRTKVYNNMYALGVNPINAAVQNEPAQDGMFVPEQHENWLV